MKRKNPRIQLDAVVGYPELGRTEGHYEVEGTQVTDTFAINQDLKLDPSGDVDYQKTWNVTHLPTGFAVLYNLPTSQSTKAAAELLDAMGYGRITSDDPDRANEAFLREGIIEMRSWLDGLIASSRTSKSLTEKIRKETRRIRRKGTAAPEKRRPPPKEKPTRPEKTPRKVAKRKPPREMDLLTLARKARKALGNPEPKMLETKERMLQW